MPAGNAASKVVEYAIQTPHSKTVLMTTEDRAEAERTLDMLGEGQLLMRTVTYGQWKPAIDDAHDLSA